MPEPLHPPYGVTQPRQLVRWLDINSQNGPLQRTNTYIVLPAFPAIPLVWNGYSEIVGSVCYVAPNNFCLQNLQEEVLATYNFLLCVAFKDDDGSIKRYKINEDVGEILYFTIPKYKNQTIKKNFRLEVWSVSATSPKLDIASPALISSLLGNVDYRYGDDKSLANTLPFNIDFYIPGNPWLFPLQFPGGSAFLPQNAVVYGQPGVVPGTVTPVGVIPIVDLQDGSIKYARVIDDSIVLSET